VVVELNNEYQSVSRSIGLAERRKIESRIAELESEVNRMVYSLYGLTGDEIRAVEG